MGLLLVLLFNKAQSKSFLHSLVSFPRHCSMCSPIGEMRMAASDSPFFLGENKPIWMHAEEREESKVRSTVGSV